MDVSEPGSQVPPAAPSEGAAARQWPARVRLPGIGRRPPGGWSAVVRTVLLLVLAVGAVFAAASLHQPRGSQDELLADLAAGRVRYLGFDTSGQEAHWVDGAWLSWHRTYVTTVDTVPAGSYPQSNPGERELAWLSRHADASPHPVFVERLRPGRRDRWLDAIVWPPLRLAAGVAWILAFLMMIDRRDHRYANRWAWFWLMIVGDVGVLLYLALEPRPLWRPAAPPRDRAPLRGGKGLLYSLVLSGLLGVAGISAWT